MTATAKTILTFLGTDASRSGAGVNGVIYSCSMIRMPDITDGASCTFMIGESYVDPDYYATAQDKGDSGDVFQGDNADNVRLGLCGLPTVTRHAWLDVLGARPVWQRTFQRPFHGVLRRIGAVYELSIDTTAYEHLCNRKDGTPVDPKQFQ